MKKHRVLMVDDDKINCIRAKRLLEKKYDIETVSSGLSALEWLRENKADLVLLDYLMPGMNGLQVFSEMQKSKKLEDIPVIFLTSDSNGKLEAELIRHGAADFVSKPFLPEVVVSRIDRAIELESYRKKLHVQLDEKSKQMDQVVLQAITTVANTIDSKDEYSSGHSSRVAYYATVFAKKLGWDEREIQNLYYLSLLHDIGKIGVPDIILNKVGELNEEEWEVIKRHTNIGADILSDIAMIHDVVLGALYHHERYDGTGYPEGLSGKEIPLVARLICIVDAYDAMTSNRIYRDKMTKDEVVEEFKRYRGAQFDPELVDLFLELVEEGIPEEGEAGIKFKLFDKTAVEDSGKLLRIVLEEKNRVSKNEAMRDSLTGLYNRRYTENQIDKVLYQSPGGGTMFMMDIDQFKGVNDHFGHIVGDTVLKSIAMLLKKHTGEDDIVCRIGGDEFLIFYYGLNDYDEICDRASNIIEDYRKLCKGNKSMKETSISIGISRSSLDGKSFQRLYKAADKALYYVKQNGRNNYHFFQAQETGKLKGMGIEENVDIRWLKSILSEKEMKVGAYQVGYKEFHRIYQFVTRTMERTGQDSVLVLITMDTASNLELEDQEFALKSMEKSIFTSLRRNDISTRYSNTQILVLLSNCSRTNAEAVIERILSDFHSKRMPFLIKSHYALTEIQLT